MENKQIHILSKAADVLSKDVDLQTLSSMLHIVLNDYVNINKLNTYVYDSVTDTMRNCLQEWCIVNEGDSVYNAYQTVKDHDFVINQKAFNLPNSIGEVNLKLTSLYIPILKNEKIFGMVEILFKPDTSVNMDFLYMMKIFAFQLSLKLQNIVLTEQSKINVEFHDAMKNIAKIIETQYELNYIVPLIGEMLDRFISDHLIYVFLKQNNEFNLVWPKACKDTRVYEALEQLKNDTEYLLTNDDKIGVFPLITDGEITGCIAARSTLDKLSKRDISYLEQLTRQSAITISRANNYSKILQYATIDALTGLNNRRQFDLRLKQEIAEAKRQNNPLCAMMIDIDFFKKVNDTYGHASGDSVLREVAAIIKQTLRESDIPSRYGGEEFAVLVPYTHIQEAQIVGERLRKAVEEKYIPLENENTDTKNIKVTISMGLAEFDNKESGEELFERADKALYEAKTTGRNRVCII